MPLRRTAADKVLAGVCGALGRYYGFQPLALRIMFVVLTFAGGFGALLYVYA
ncbi:MAG: PspC domain-containing protein [Actinomycetota bacterium]